MSFTITCNNCGQSITLKEDNSKPFGYPEWPDEIYIVKDNRCGGGDINCDKCKHEVNFI